MNLLIADGLESLVAWCSRHGMPVFVACLFGLAIADRFLAGLRGRAVADPENNDYADPSNDLDPGVPDER